VRREKNPSIARQKIPRRTGCDRQQISDEHAHAQLTYQPSHKQQAAEDGDSSIAKMKAEHAQTSLRQMRVDAVAPGEPPVPYEIVQHRGLYREPGCPHVFAAEGGQHFESRKLHHNSDGADQSESGKTLKAEDRDNGPPRTPAHEIFSSR
jgi:hypothetical protein